MSLRRASALLLAACAGTFGQRLVDATRLSPELRFFDPTAASTMNCDVRPMEPRLDFGFRFRTGYFVRVPMKQYSGVGHGWGILTRITPEAEGAKRVYLLSTFRLPEIPKTDQDLELSGSYLVGSGKYKVDWLLIDDKGRACRKQWTAEARLAPADRDVKLRIPDGAVWDYTLRDGPRQATPGKYRITLLVHAAPLMFRATKMRSFDRAMLLGALTTLLESISTQTVKLTVFSLEKQQELLKNDNFHLDDMEEVADIVDGLELNLVDYQVLRRKKGHVDLLADLLNAEMRAAQPADAVVLLGPLSKFGDKVPPGALEAGSQGGPPFFYLQYRSRFRRGEEFPDSIQSAMKRVKGKVSVIYTPRDFAKALKQVEEKLAEGARSAKP